MRLLTHFCLIILWVGIFLIGKKLKRFCNSTLSEVVHCRCTSNVKTTLSSTNLMLISPSVYMHITHVSNTKDPNSGRILIKHSYFLSSILIKRKYSYQGIKSWFSSCVSLVHWTIYQLQVQRLTLDDRNSNENESHS